MNIDAILASRPLNGAAATVTGQAGCDADLRDATRQELVESRHRLNAKQNQIARAMGLGNSRQRANFRYKLNKGRWPEIARQNPRLMAEYERNKRAIVILEQRVQEMDAKTGGGA